MVGFGIGDIVNETKIKRHFRVLEYKKGFTILYLSQMKTWFGWRSFQCGETGNCYFDNSPNCSDRWSKVIIENYRKSRGLYENEILISEITKR